MITGFSAGISYQALPVELEDQSQWKYAHALTVEFLGLLHLVTEVDQTQGRNDTQAQADTPGRSQMILSANQTHNHGHQSRHYEPKVDLEVSEHDEPPVAVALLELAGILCTGDRASRIFTTNADSDEKPIGSECCEHPVGAVMVTIGACAESCENE